MRSVPEADSQASEEPLASPTEADEDQDNELSGHIRAFAARVREARVDQEQWVERCLAFIKPMVPWEPAELARFGSLTNGWGLPDSDLDVAVVMPRHAGVSGNGLLEHLLEALRVATARGDRRVSKIVDARGD